MFPLFLAMLSPTEWITFGDYPQMAFDKGHEGAVKVEYTFDVTGRASQCTVVVSSGWPELDKVTCDKILQRARAKPFKDKDGSLIPVVANLKFNWYLPGSRPRPYNPLMTDAEVDVAALPKGTKRALADVACLVAVDGKPESCSIWNEGGTGSTGLDRAACNVLMNGILPVVKDTAGKPIRYLRIVTVLFKAPAPVSR